MTYCQEKVWVSENSTHMHKTRKVYKRPCSNKASCDPVNGKATMCGVHSKAAKAKRNTKALEKELVQYNKMRDIGIKKGIDISAIDMLISETIEKINA